MTKNISAESLKKAICYYYLLTYCSPEGISAHKKALRSMRKEAENLSDMKVGEFFKLAAREASHHIVAFHQRTREPDADWVEALTKSALKADSSPKGAAAFQDMMTLVARLPGRAKPENRLHRRRGCQYCAVPCHYGYFSLVSEPDFDTLQGFLDTELSALQEGKKPIMAVTSFALTHIVETAGIGTGGLNIAPDHLANLAYCLLTLATAKSRLPFPEKQFRLFQAVNQHFSVNRIPVAIEE